MYDPLEIPWTLPTHHERKIFTTQVQEVFYNRIFQFLGLVLGMIPVAIRFNIFWYFIMVIFILLLFYPIFIRPWEIVLSNKRLILRNKYWNVGRFSTVISIHLNKMDTQSTTPRIKVIPITLGFTILFSFTFVLIEYILTRSLPVPIYLKLLFLFRESIPFLPYLHEIRGSGESIVYTLFAPFLPLAIYFVAISTAIAVLLIAFGMPRKRKMIISTTGGHKFSIGTGIPETLSELLFAVGRKHRLEKQTDWDWQIPLLDDEIVKTRSKVGLIDRTPQIMGLLSLVLFLDGLDQMFKFVLSISLENFILLSLRLFDLAFIYIAIIFAKKYRRIIATNHRLIYQEERREVSGLWGKRVYQYNDLPYEYLQGFSYSNYSGILSGAILGSILIYIGGLSLILYYQSLQLFVWLVVVIIIYIGLNFKTFTSLEFLSLGGDRIRVFYQLPVFMARLSHRIENQDWIYNRLFPNILSEQEIVSICNSVRNVEKPRLNPYDSHSITIDSFIDQTEEILESWEKLGPYKYVNLSIIFGAVSGTFTTIYLAFWYFEDFSPFPFLILGLLLTVVATMNNYVINRRSLLIMNNRLFQVEEILPRRVALFFGILPRRTITEVHLKYVLISRLRYFFGTTISEAIQLATIIGISGLILNTHEIVNFSSYEVGNLVLQHIIAMVMVSLLPILVKALFQLIPRYGLRIYTRFGEINIPYINRLNKFHQAVEQARLLS